MDRTGKRWNHTAGRTGNHAEPQSAAPIKLEPTPTAGEQLPKSYPTECPRSLAIKQHNRSCGYLTKILCVLSRNFVDLRAHLKIPVW